MEENKRWPPSKEGFEELYVKQNLKAKDIASMFGVSVSKVYQFTSDTGIKKPAGYHFQPEPKKGALDGITDEELKKLYIEQNLASDEIAAIFKVSKSIVATVLSRRRIHKPKELFIQKQKERNLEKYGVTTTLKLKSVQDKISETCLEKYGTTSVASVGGKKVHEKLKGNPFTEEEKKAICDKRRETLQKQYGVDRVCDIPGLRDKIEQTNLEKYGCKNPMQNEEVKEKLKQSNLEKFGVENFTKSVQYSKNNEIYSKIDIEFLKKQYCVDNMSVKQLTEFYNLEEDCMYSFLSRNNITKDKTLTYVHRDVTNIEKYGYSSPNKNKAVREKTRQTNIEKYGFGCCLQNPEVREKGLKTMQQNGTVNTSSQQLELYKIIKDKYPQNTFLNKALKEVSLDIAIELDNCLINVEYDGWYWHRDRKEQDRKRDYFLYSNGYKVLRIRSAYALPTKEELFEAIGYLITTSHHHKIITFPDWDEQEQKYQNKLKEKSSDAH